jgi:hypothetical protein
MSNRGCLDGMTVVVLPDDIDTVNAGLVGELLAA